MVLSLGIRIEITFYISVQTKLVTLTISETAGALMHFVSMLTDTVSNCSTICAIQKIQAADVLCRKVSKCYRGNAQSPIIVHCSDGCGRTGSYILLDLVIARMVKGTCKEIDIAATLEHLRDQRAGRIVATKVNFWLQPQSVRVCLA